MNYVFFSTCLVSCISLFSAHSLLSYPRPTAAKACRLGGVPQRGGIALCPGPCDVRALQPGYPHITSPDRPAAIWRRGQSVIIKYQRNNHGPGGFVRHSLVPLSKMMDKKVHAKNAFHFSCWGANPVPAKSNELGSDRHGFSLVGGDGKLHDGKISYLTTNITIPTVIPDGVYVLGWVWYGGMGGSLTQNTPENPFRVGLFADYWSCSFIKIEGGSPLTQRYTPRFENDMKEYWPNGCMSANSRPGVCTYEPCRMEGKIQKPFEFKNGKVPKALKQSNFMSPVVGRTSNQVFSVPTPLPGENMLRDALINLYNCNERVRTLEMQQKS